MNRLVAIAFSTVAAVVPLGAQLDGDQHSGDQVPQRTEPWAAEVIDTWSRIPVQDHGRIKPLSTAALWMLTRINGRAKCSVQLPGDTDKTQLGAVEWMLDCLFFPEQAEQYPVILVQNSEALDAIGLQDVAKKKRDRYRYVDLVPARARLGALAQEYAKIDSNARNPLQGQVLDLWRSFHDYATLLHYFEPVRKRYAVDRSQGLKLLFDGRAEASFGEVVAKLPQIAVMYRELMSATGEAKRVERETEMAALDALSNDVSRASAPAYGLAILPPPSTEIEEWMTPRDVVDLAIGQQVVFEDAVPLLNRFESLVAARGNPTAFAAELDELQNGIAAAATARGEYDKIPLEISYYSWDFFYNALLLYGLGFLVVVALWLRPRSRVLPKVLWASALVPTGLVVGGIIVRCILRDRPPVSTLYETILFITAVGALTLFFVEWVNRKRVALPMSVILGVIGMFLAMKFEQTDGEDTMPALVAVLDTNFWLATHVTTVTAGYSAGLLAALFGHVYLLGKLLGIKRGDPQFYRNVARMTYGALCFGVVFSVVGTILGGIWANYSWGRVLGLGPEGKRCADDRAVGTRDLARPHGWLHPRLRSLHVGDFRGQRRLVLVVAREPPRRRSAQLRVHCRRHRVALHVL